MGRSLMAKGYILLISVAIVAFKLAEADRPTIFLFGDSTLDVGTNNYLNKSLARADHPYYGIDYPKSIPTGRFSNGQNTADMIAKLLGNYKRSPPPFLHLLKRSFSFKSDILLGANFASGGSGIFDQTGKHQFKRVISLGEQIQQFATASGNITEVLGTAAAQRLIANSVYIISVGSNDFFEYLSSKNRTLPPETLLTTLIQAYAIHLKNLYKLGARKFGIISVGPIGCCPAVRITNSSGDCVEAANQLAQAFYKSADALLQQFSSENDGVKYSLANTYYMTMGIIDNPIASGFKDIKTACCGGGQFNAESKCETGANLCSNRPDNLFWDLFHPTQAASQLAALTIVYADGPEFVKPMNFSTLALVQV